jgi:hypothetical protein
MAETTNFKIFVGTAPTLRFTLTKPEPVTGWTTVFYLRTAAGANVVFQQNGVISPDVPTAQTVGIFDVALHAANTSLWNVRTYAWSFERTNAGFEDVLALGEVRVETR